MEKLKRCSERRMVDKLSLSSCGTERQERVESEAGRGWGGGGGRQRRMGGLQKGRGYLFVMDKMAGERGKFQSRVDGMVGGGGGGQCTCDNVGRQRTGQSASGGQQMRRQPSKQVTMCLYRAVYVIMDSYSLSCPSWCTGLPSEVTAVLDKERFTSLAPLKHSTEDDIKELNLRRGLHV